MLSLMILSDPLSIEIDESFSICVVQYGLISEFLTVSYYILKLDFSKFIGKLCLVRSYHKITGRCKPGFEKKPIRKSFWEVDSMILQNLMFRWNPLFVLINIVELILLVSS